MEGPAMTKAQILAELQAWERVQKGLDAQLDKLYDLLGTSGESPLLDAMYDVTAAHTEAVARIIGDDTKALEWWKYDCRFGENPMQAAIHGKKLRLISNLKQLAGLICAP